MQPKHSSRNITEIATTNLQIENDDFPLNHSLFKPKQDLKLNFINCSKDPRDLLVGLTLQQQKPKKTVTQPQVFFWSSGHVGPTVDPDQRSEVKTE